MLKRGKRTKGSVSCSTYIDNLSAIIVYLLNILKTNDSIIDDKIEEYKKIVKSIKYEENIDILGTFRDLVTEFVIEYDNYLTEKKGKESRLILGNISMLISLAKRLENSKKWITTLDNIKEILKTKLDLDSLSKTKDMLVNLGYSSKDTRDVVYSDIIEMLFSLLNVETDSDRAKQYLEKIKTAQRKLSVNPYSIDSADTRDILKDLVKEKERLEEEYIQSLNNKLSKALKALIYTITTFSSSSSDYVDTFQEHIDEINNTISTENIDIDELSKRLIGVAIKIKDTTVNMKNELNQYSKKMKEAKDTIEELKLKLNKAKTNMITDSLTEIYNRRGLFHFMKIEIERTIRYGQPFSIIMADLDHFSNVNNSYGHLVGDIVLKKFCSTSRLIIRKIDILARYGGEEFIVILPNSEIDNAYTVAEKIRNAISKLKFQYKDKVFSITSSFGVAQFRKGDSVESLIERADKALYKAKEKRNCTVKES